MQTGERKKRFFNQERRSLRRVLRVCFAWSRGEKGKRRNVRVTHRVTSISLFRHEQPISYSYSRNPGIAHSSRIVRTRTRVNVGAISRLRTVRVLNKNALTRAHARGGESGAAADCLYTQSGILDKFRVRRVQVKMATGRTEQGK